MGLSTNLHEANKQPRKKRKFNPCKKVGIEVEIKISLLRLPRREVNYTPLKKANYTYDDEQNVRGKINPLYLYTTHYENSKI